jgi:UDP-glucose 4-epimerase
MRVLIVGGFGYLGGWLASGLGARGHDVIVAGRRIPGVERHRSFQSLEWDVLDSITAQTSRLATLEVDAVIDLASLDENEAVHDPDLALRVSAEGVRRLLMARSSEVRLVFMSTFHVYGPQPPAMIDEDTPTKPAHPYAIAHLAAEGYCREANARGATPAVILRLSNGYGGPIDLDVDRWTLAHNDFCLQATRDGCVKLKTSGNQKRDFVWMDDVAQAVDLCLRASALGEAVFNIGGDNVMTIFALAQLVARRASVVIGKTVSVDRVDDGRRASDFRISIDRLRELGFQPHDRLEQETDSLIRKLREKHG